MDNEEHHLNLTKPLTDCVPKLLTPLPVVDTSIQFIDSMLSLFLIYINQCQCRNRAKGQTKIRYHCTK